MSDLESLARAWAVERRSAITLRADRNAKVCTEADEHSYFQYCRHLMTTDGGSVPEEQWCQPCRDRQSIHEAYRQATTRRAVAMLKLARFVERPLAPDAPREEVTP